MKKIDPAVVASLTIAGFSANAIAKELGFTVRTVVRARGRAGVAQPPGRPITDDELATIEEMLADGAPIIEIERTLGRPRGTLGRRLRGRGWSSLQTAQFAGHCSRMARLERSRR